MLYSKTARKNLVKQCASNIAFAALLCLAPCHAARTAQARDIVDVTGTKVTVGEHPQRIVTLAPSLGELAADLAGENLERIVGVSDFTDYPPALSKIKSVGSYSHFNLEAVVGLKPDLVVATHDGNAKDQVEHLRELHVPVVVVNTETFAQIDESVRILSQAMGEEKTGAALIARLNQGLERIGERKKARLKKGKPAPKVLIELDSSRLVVAGKSSFLNEALDRVGATNVYDDVASAYPRPTVEDAVRRDPDVIIVFGMGKRMENFEHAKKDWSRFPKMRAVQSGKVLVVNGDTILRPSLRILEGLTILEQAIHVQ